MRNPWVAIMQAADLGVGLRFTAEEIRLLARDGAIESCAGNDVAQVDVTLDPINSGWANIDPKKYPINTSLLPVGQKP